MTFPVFYSAFLIGLVSFLLAPAAFLLEHVWLLFCSYNNENPAPGRA